MKRVLMIPLALAWIACPFTLGGCGDDSSNPSTSQDTGLTDDEIATTSEITGAVGSIFQIGATVEAAVREALSHPGGGAAKLPSTCPTAHVDAIGIGHVELTLDYGAGCTNESGKTTSGALHASYRAGTPVDTIRIVFDDFAMDGTAIDGDFGATGSGTAWTFSYDGTLTDGSKSAGLIVTFGLVVDLAGTPADPSDDSETFTGGGSYSEGGQTYVIAITQPLVLASGCNYPITGKLTYQLQSDHQTPVTTVDFGAGDCCTILVSVGGRSEEMSLCQTP